MKLHLQSLLVAALTISNLVFANWEKIPSMDFKVAPPPAEGSAEYKKDYEELHKLQDARTAQECDVARGQEDPTVKTLYRDTGLLSKTEFSKTKKLIQDVLDLTERVTDYHKKKFMRTRPYNADKTITPCIKMPTSNKSYPSSHASMALAGACVLSKLFPGNAKAIMDEGKYSGTLRLIGGVHHPSDVAAGQKLGQEICDRLFQETDFNQAFEQVKDTL